MGETNAFVVPLIQRVFHPSNFSEDGHAAFTHALVVALIAKARLTLLHVSSHRDDSWSDFPGVRDTLERWNLLPHNSQRIDITRLGIDVEKVQLIHDDPVESIMIYVEEHGTDLMVLSTDQHKHEVSWLNRSVAGEIARKSREMALFIPRGIEGFVALDTGVISLNNILIPVAPVPRAQPAVHAAARLVSGLRCEAGMVTLLHVGTEETVPPVSCPELTGWRWNRMTRSGEVVDVILQVARDTDADLIVMASDGRNGFVDELRGSHSERVLQECCCPLLTIPADGFITTVL